MKSLKKNFSNPSLRQFLGFSVKMVLWYMVIGEAYMMKVEKIRVCHCTGMRAAFRFQQEFGDRFFYGHVGSGLEI